MSMIEHRNRHKAEQYLSVHGFQYGITGLFWGVSLGVDKHNDFTKAALQRLKMYGINEVPDAIERNKFYSLSESGEEVLCREITGAVESEIASVLETVKRGRVATGELREYISDSAKRN